MPCLSIAGACAIPRTMASLLIVTQVECPLPRIPAKETTGWPLWCGECLRQVASFISFSPLRMSFIHSINCLLTTCPVLRLPYSTHLPPHPPITQGLNCRLPLWSVGRRAMACRIVQQ
ncbi:hypothetical protein B0H13DRAFT_2081505 [Mycena leptocephala]|nr:hypothetical protein B0H13DRAFT_2157262 [Mycena leptocephala]KAJ7854114.1 hypothetical protein B0H13DRAFT_2081505 [Mycena leptocephala]